MKKTRIIWGKENRLIYSDAIAYYKYYDYPGKIIMEHPYIRENDDRKYRGYLYMTDDVKEYVLNHMVNIIRNGGLPNKPMTFLSEQEVLI
jgi:hypothetical protein